MAKIPSSEIKASRREALAKVRNLLLAPDVEGQFAGRMPFNHWDPKKFLVVWKGHFRGMPSEYRLDLSDGAYRTFSGYAASYVAVGLFHEVQFKGFGTVWRGLVHVGLLLCAGRAEKARFYRDFAVPYNEALKRRQVEQ